VSISGEFKYVSGWFTIFVNDETGLIERLGPFETEELAKAERKKLLQEDPANGF
jgi:hypothetical protein